MDHTYYIVPLFASTSVESVELLTTFIKRKQTNRQGQRQLTTTTDRAELGGAGDDFCGAAAEWSTRMKWANDIFVKPCQLLPVLYPATPTSLYCTAYFAA
jgi:hypothetical protein